MLSLAGLWGFAASVTIGNVTNNDHFNTSTNTIAPSLGGLEQGLENEEGVTLAWLTNGRQSTAIQSQLQAARHGTDTITATARGALASVHGLLSPVAQTDLTNLLTSLDGLSAIRSTVDSGADSPTAAYSAYNAINSNLFAFFHNSTPPSDVTLSLMTQAAIAESRVGVFTSAANGIVGGALAAGRQMKQAERVLFDQLVEGQNLEVSDAVSLAPPQLAAVFGQYFDGTAFRQLTAVQARILAAAPGSPIPVSLAAFTKTTEAVAAANLALLPKVAPILAARSAQLSSDLRNELYLAAGLGLLAVLVSGYVAYRFGTRLRVELTGLYASAREMAEERLPRLVERLRRGDDVDVEVESPPLRAGQRVTEIANVAQAFSSVQRTAVEAAVGQANLRKGVNQVFVSLSLRNQSLLHRQLAMLDDMERATSDPVALGDLFSLDHLTTRMRRHAEGLLILAGETPGRGWRDPVPVLDVLNAAVAEVEDYVRVDVTSDSTDAVAGTAVNDVIHLLAELIENATTFSPPKTRVEVRGDSVGHGFAIEIEDRGLGMPDAELAAINGRLASPPEFDIANTDQLGLFVAARLAARHEVKVALRRSPFGGTTAIVLLPLTIMESADGTAWTPGTNDTSGQPPAPALAGAPGRGGDGASDQAFGLTGRHRRDYAGPGPMPGPRRDPAPLALAPPLASPATRPAPAEAPAPAGAPAPGGWFSPPPGGRSPASDADTADTAFRGRAAAPQGQESAAPGWGSAPQGRSTAGPSRSTAAPGRGAGPQGRPGLPRRQRQASLAPQLRRTAATPETGRGSSGWPAEEEAADRSPEEASSLLSALQDGWERGRLDNIRDFDEQDQP
jgi:signal transduction histidine kinase